MQNKSNDNAPRHFNLTARILHWLMAAAILAMLFIGVGMTTSMTWRPWLIDIHRPLGIAILLLVIIRLINRLCYQFHLCRRLYHAGKRFLLMHHIGYFIF